MEKRQQEFISNLKYYRNLRNISQAKLAELCECQPGTIGCIESARQFPSFELLFKICDALEIEPADLFLRNASVCALETKKTLETKLLPLIKDFIDTEF